MKMRMSSSWALSVLNLKAREWKRRAGHCWRAIRSSSKRVLKMGKRVLGMWKSYAVIQAHTIPKSCSLIDEERPRKSWIPRVFHLIVRKRTWNSWSSKKRRCMSANAVNCKEATTRKAERWDKVLLWSQFLSEEIEKLNIRHNHHKWA